MFLAPGEFLPLLPTKITESPLQFKILYLCLNLCSHGGFLCCCNGTPCCCGTVVQQHAEPCEAILVKMTHFRTPLQPEGRAPLSQHCPWSIVQWSFQVASKEGKPRQPDQPRGCLRGENCSSCSGCPQLD